MTYKPRTYRRWVKSDGLVTFEVIEKETDLLISASVDLKDAAKEAVLGYRADIERYMRSDPRFFSSLEPIEVHRDAPEIIKAMANAGQKAGVGPMAAIAGAMAHFVGKYLLKSSEQVIVENGGDIFMRTLSKKVVGIYAGDGSPFSGKLAVEIEPADGGIGVCTSSGTVSHSLSFGKADVALIIADDAALADAAATAAGNAVKTAGDIEKGIAVAKSIDGIKGALIIVGDKLGTWGDIRLV